MAARTSRLRRLEAVEGVLLGTAVGDAIGLPMEGMSRRRARRLFGDGPLRHRLLFGRGMVSDDTEHACMTAQALLAARGDRGCFAQSLAWKLRCWLLGLPAGLGWATLRAILKLWFGVSPTNSGVWSAGNGPAMRAPILGVCHGYDEERLRAFVRASTRLTHTDPRAEEGALLVACASHLGASDEVLEPDRVLAELSRFVEGDELADALRIVGAHLERGSQPVELADDLGLEDGVTGYINHTVPIALFCWLRYPDDFKRSVTAVIELGGDTDTTGAIVGALAGASCGSGTIPTEWLDGVFEWPRSVSWMRALAERLVRRFFDDDDVGPLPLFWPGIVPRNVLFTATVLSHGFRRLLPPY
jgi:ADP-ribosyl-[dinitrogen reductase] hydrolase